jgi:hypothetical protein
MQRSPWNPPWVARNIGMKNVSGEGLRPLQNIPFCPISASGSDFNPQNTQGIPLVKIFAFLDLEQN